MDKVGKQSAEASTDIGRSGELHLIGWAADVASKMVPPVVIIELNGAKRWFAPAVRATPRPDVAAAFAIPGLVASGWDLLADLSPVPVGNYDVRVLEVSSAGFPLVCDPKRRLNVK